MRCAQFNLERPVFPKRSDIDAFIYALLRDETFRLQVSCYDPMSTLSAWERLEFVGYMAFMYLIKDIEDIPSKFTNFIFVGKFEKCIATRIL